MVRSTADCDDAASSASVKGQAGASRSTISMQNATLPLPSRNGLVIASSRFQVTVRGEPVAPLSASQRSASGSVDAPTDSAETEANTACTTRGSAGSAANVGQTPSS